MVLGSTVNIKKLKAGSRPNSDDIPYTLYILRVEAIGFPTSVGLLS